MDAVGRGVAGLREIVCSRQSYYTTADDDGIGISHGGGGGGLGTKERRRRHGGYFVMLQLLQQQVQVLPKVGEIIRSIQKVEGATCRSGEAAGKVQLQKKKVAPRPGNILPCVGTT